MLELDYVLGRYLEEQYEVADDQQRRDFVRLLAQEDRDLYAWVIHGQTPADASLGDIVRRVRGI
jgi:succinate dehydrogenase flavin-adding protein (antitoxin of CptAB toxin-antitoxin module)